MSIYLMSDAWKLEGISSTEKLVLLALCDWSNEEGVCYPSVAKLQKKCSLSDRGVQKILASLQEKGFIVKKILTDQEAFNKLLQLNEPYLQGCSFCGWDKSILDEHHYPVRKKDGGSKTIDLCPNCHRHFHQLTDYGVIEIMIKGVA